MAIFNSYVSLPEGSEKNVVLVVLVVPLVAPSPPSPKISWAAGGRAKSFGQDGNSSAMGPWGSTRAKSGEPGIHQLIGGKHPVIYMVSTCFNMFQPSPIDAGFRKHLTIHSVISMIWS